MRRLLLLPPSLHVGPGVAQTGQAERERVRVDVGVPELMVPRLWQRVQLGQSEQLRAPRNVEQPLLPELVVQLDELLEEMVVGPHVSPLPGARLNRKTF